MPVAWHDQRFDGLRARAGPGSASRFGDQIVVCHGNAAVVLAVHEQQRASVPGGGEPRVRVVDGMATRGQQDGSSQVGEGSGDRIGYVDLGYLEGLARHANQVCR